MTVSERNIFVWWGYLLARLFGGEAPVRTNLCKLFWLNVLVALTIGLVGLLVAASIVWWLPTLQILAFVMAIAGLMGGVFGILYFLTEVPEGPTRVIVREYLQGRKEKYCPIITIGEDS